MSQSKFASITSSLLARKGEAKPWEDHAKTAPGWTGDATLPLAAGASPVFAGVKASAPRQDVCQVRDVEFSDPFAPPESDEQEKIKKCTIRMSIHDYERLGIIAVKRNVTRQQLLHDALDQFFAAAAEKYRKDCACLKSEACPR